MLLPVNVKKIEDVGGENGQKPSPTYQTCRQCISVPTYVTNIDVAGQYEMTVFRKALILFHLKWSFLRCKLPFFLVFGRF